MPTILLQHTSSTNPAYSRDQNSPLSRENASSSKITANDLTPTDVEDSGRSDRNLLAQNDIAHLGGSASWTFDPGTLCKTDAECAGTGICLLKQDACKANVSIAPWSEYNHHWAGLIVLAAGLLAALSYRFRFARHWPLAFFGLAVFLLIRSDSENWPLGPRGFWESFQVAEVAQHRFFVLLLIAFAVFEWAVRTNRLAPQRAGLVFPLVCAVGGAVLMTHSHSLGNVKEEFLAELSHMPLSLLAVAAGWSRWLEIRLPARQVRVAASIWPVCLVLIGIVLVLYRES